jgi:hypothetical protein
MQKGQVTRAVADKKKTIIELSQRGDHAQEIATLVGLDPETVARVLKSADRSTSKKSKCMHDFFDVIDTEEKAYWLGFLTCDGSISKRNQISCSLKAQDRGHLEKLRTALGSDNPVGEAKDTGGYGRGNKHNSFRETSPQMSRALQIHWHSRNKAGRKVPDDLQETMARHYWRGVIDADGTIGLYETSTKKYKNTRYRYRQWIVQIKSPTADVVNGLRSFCSQLALPLDGHSGDGATS